MNDPATLPLKFPEMTANERNNVLKSCILVALTMRSDGRDYGMPIIRHNVVLIENHGLRKSQLMKRIDRSHQASKEEWDAVFTELYQSHAIYSIELNYSEPDDPTYLKGRWESQIRFMRD